MDLTLFYVKFTFNQIGRDEIVFFVDNQIQNGLCLNDEVMELSLSKTIDDYEFEKRLLRFVKFPIALEQVKYVVYKGLKRIDGFNDHGLLHGLMIARNIWGLDDEYSELYFHLDHYLIDEREYTGVDTIKLYIDEWISKRNYSVYNHFE